MTMKELLQSEELCLTYRDKSCAWLRHFYSPTSHAFHISASVDQPLLRTVAPNVATSHIGVVVHDLLRSNLPLITTDEKRLQKSVLEASTEFIQTPPKELLPLHSFGRLPLFSTSFLHEFLALDNSCCSNLSFAITSRRLLYLVFEILIRDADSQVEPHPYLLYRLARNMVLLRELLNVKRTDFIRLMRDESSLLGEVSDEPELGELLGFAGRSADFNRRVLSQLENNSLARL